MFSRTWLLLAIGLAFAAVVYTVSLNDDDIAEAVIQRELENLDLDDDVDFRELGEEDDLDDVITLNEIKELLREEEDDDNQGQQAPEKKIFRRIARSRIVRTGANVGRRIIRAGGRFGRRIIRLFG